MFPISDNHSSFDQQVDDAMDYLVDADPEAHGAIVALFPEWSAVTFDGAWVDTESLGLDPEFTSWLADAIESKSDIFWDEGEPFYPSTTTTTTNEGK